ncbi:hypothetical protein, partial [Sinomonas albida]|uniref:hypothetical protein n=1 Tax=Sinomonas albida TaxID=369942 RepID=UPI001B3C5D24
QDQTLRQKQKNKENQDKAEKPRPGNPIQAETQPTHTGCAQTRQTAIKKMASIQTWHAIEFSNNRPNRYIPKHKTRNISPPNEFQPYRLPRPLANPRFGEFEG